MPSRDERSREHLFPLGTATPERFQLPPPNIDQIDIPTRDRTRHARTLREQLATVRNESRATREDQEIDLHEGLGIQIEFESFPDISLAFESLSRENQGIELLNVRHGDNQTFATVFVPDGKLEHFEKLIADYVEERKDRNRRPLDHRKLIDTVQAIRTATLEALWTDDLDAFPQSDDEVFWWEIWLPARKDRDAFIAQFRVNASNSDITIAEPELRFPERSVVLAQTSAGQLKHSLLTLNSIAELRRAKETADFFDSLEGNEQTEWLDDLLARMNYTAPADSVPHVCILDTGITRGHPFVINAIGLGDLHTIEPAWGVDDGHGHGTEMAGLALGGDLTALLDDDAPIEIAHRLESVKLLPGSGANGNDPVHHGHITVQAVSRPEITAPNRARVFGMAITARDNRDRGRPSAWSAAIDSLASDAGEDGKTPRLFIVSAGNVMDNRAWANCPTSNSSDSVHDPAQAWNALTVGACTDLVHITEPDTGAYRCIAPSGGLSPFSTTSVIWESHWPIKPDVLFEGGNAANDGTGAISFPSLSLLTTSHRPTERLFTTAKRHERGHRTGGAIGSTDYGSISKAPPGDGARSDRPFSRMDRSNALRFLAARSNSF